jgi:hypothetical protein
MVFCVAVATLAWPAAARAAPERAKSADAVVESAGVNTHIAFFGGAYGNYGAWKAKLVALRARYIRDGLTAGDPIQHARLNDLAASGIRANLLMGDPKNKYGNGTLDQLLSAVKTQVRSAVVSVEGPNEWDTSAGSYPCDPAHPELGCWASDLRAYQQELYAKVKADPALAGLTVVGPAFALGDRRAVGDLSPWLDYGNMHPYPGNRNPEWSLNPSAGDQFGIAAINSGGAPVFATETGYHNALQSAQGHDPVSERASGIYAPRLLLDYFGQASSRGQTVRRTFFYELIDQGSNSLTDFQHSFGLLRNDLSEKPAYKALTNLLTLVEDRGPAFDPGSLDYSLDGATSDVRRLLLQKRDGSFWLALWREVDVWNEIGGGDLYPGDEQVTLRLAQPIARATAYRPSLSADPQESWGRTSAMQVRVPADVVLLRLEPAGSRTDRPVIGCACSGHKEVPHSRCPNSRKRRARRFQLHLGKARRASKISIRWRAGRSRRYRVSTSAGGRKFHRAGVVRLRKNGRGHVRFRPRRVGCVRLAQADRRPPAAGTISRRNLRIGGGRHRRGAR